MHSKFLSILMASVILLSLGACSKAYWRRFVIDEGKNPAQPSLLINLGTFELWFFVDVSVYSRKKIVDSTYSIDMRVEALNRELEHRMQFAKAFKLDRLAVRFDNSGELLEQTAIKRDTILHTTRAIDFERLTIPETVDTLKLHLWYEYLSDDEQMIIDSTIVRLVRSEGHYTVPLGRFMN